MLGTKHLYLAVAVTHKKTVTTTVTATVTVTVTVTATVTREVEEEQVRCPPPLPAVRPLTAVVQVCLLMWRCG